MRDHWEKLSKNEWLTLVQKELKDKPYESIIRQISSNISAEPYYTSEETGGTFNPLIVHNNWQSAEDFYYEAGNEASLNAQILEALNGGIQSITMHIADIPESKVLESIFKDISTEAVSIFFKFQKNESAEHIHGLLKDLCRISNIAPSQLQGGIMQNGNEIEPFPDFPLLKVYFVKGNEEECTQAPEQILAFLLLQADRIIQAANSNESNDILPKFHFSLSIGNDFLLEMSKIRAFYLLWANYQLALGIATPEQPFIHAGICVNAYTEDENKNMIKASAMAMAAITGGASRITIRPSGAEGSSFQRRIARNVLNLLELEAGMKNIPDPAAGSYYIEILTQKLADAAWDLFLHQRNA